MEGEHTDEDQAKLLNPDIEENVEEGADDDLTRDEGSKDEGDDGGESFGEGFDVTHVDIDEDEARVWDAEIKQPEPEPPYFEYVDSQIQIAIVSLFCCFMIGISAIVKSCESKEYGLRKEYNSARKVARTAKEWAVVAIILGGIGFSVLLIVSVVSK